MEGEGLSNSGTDEMIKQKQLANKRSMTTSWTRKPACLTVQIITPKKWLLNGLWFGPVKPKHLIVWVHGLTSSAFSMGHVVEKLINRDTAVLTFNNRGFGIVNSISQNKKKNSRTIVAGGAHEVFSECVDDIQGAINFARTTGVRDIYLAGHSTGCQKSVYWASKKSGGKAVRGIILFAPVSDYADLLQRDNGGRRKRLTKLAQGFLKRGKPHEFLPEPADVFPWGTFFCDAQRYLSLYTADSDETIFCYEQKGKIPKALCAVKVPLLVLWAENDEFADRSAAETAQWFGSHIRSKHEVAIIPGVSHNFRGREKSVASLLHRWIDSLGNAKPK